MSGRRGVFWPLLLIAIGVLFLLSNYGFLAGFSPLAILQLWPLLLVLIGLDLAFARRWPLPTLVAEVLVIAGGLALAATQPNLVAGDFFRFGGRNDGGESDVTVPRNGTNPYTLRLSGGSGRYRISGGATALVEAHSENRDLRLRLGGRDRSEVRIDQGGAGPFRAGGTDVQVRVASDVPVAIDFSAGAGELDVDLTDVRTNDVRINAGASNLRLTLPKPSGEVSVRVAAGASSIAITVPEGVEARVTTTGGLLTLRSENARLGGDGGTGGCFACGSTVETTGYAAAKDRVSVQATAGASSITVR